ncbi:hypothetical protein NH340_JMT04878 [Sarcoptes scabiei]|nr:hypothetical protein NH340_JMT04878 [Sarcoptes scabiei]
MILSKPLRQQPFVWLSKYFSTTYCLSSSSASTSSVIRLKHNAIETSPLQFSNAIEIKPIRMFSSEKCTKKTKEIEGKFADEGLGNLSVRQKLKKLVVLYGPIATVLHIILSLMFLGLTYLIVRFGFDSIGFLNHDYFMNDSYLRILASGGQFGLAYAIYKSLMPFRVIVTLFLTPRVATKLQSMGLIKKRT